MTVNDRTMFTHRRFHACVAIAVAYLAAAQLGFSFAFEVKQVTAVWPPSGLALAAVILLGVEIWPGVFIGAFICNSIIGVPVIAAVAIAAGNTVAPVLAGLILRDKFVLSPKLSRLSDVLSLSLVGAVTMAISATKWHPPVVSHGYYRKRKCVAGVDGLVGWGRYGRDPDCSIASHMDCIIRTAEAFDGSRY